MSAHIRSARARDARAKRALSTTARARPRARARAPLTRVTALRARANLQFILLPYSEFAAYAIAQRADIRIVDKLMQLICDLPLFNFDNLTHLSPTAQQPTRQRMHTAVSVRARARASTGAHACLSRIGARARSARAARTETQPPRIARVLHCYRARNIAARIAVLSTDAARSACARQG